MRDFNTSQALIIGAFLCLFVTHLAKAQQKPAWTWKDASGKTHTRAELEEIVRKHRLWVESLESAVLSGNQERILNPEPGTQANLTGATLDDAHLERARLDGADLENVRLRYAHLSGTQFISAHLAHAELAGADLQSANLLDADLTGVWLRGANLAQALLSGADLARVNFEPEQLPQFRGMADAKNIELLTYVDEPDALVQLRRQFQDGGFREQERKVTYALKRREAELSRDGCTSRKTSEGEVRAILWSSDGNLANCGSFFLNRVFFDWTCQYGMSPGRPLTLGVLLWLLCSLLYFGCIRAVGEAGLYRVYAKGIQEDASAHQRVERIAPAITAQTRGMRRLLQFFWREWAVFRASMFFSLMSAFNIGFRDINFGRWLRLLTRQEFDIKALGWARVVSGWQSLISVFLIALWVLTYFGRPFG